MAKRAKPPARRKKGTTPDSEADDVQEAQAPVKPTRKQKKMSPVVEESEIEEIEPPPKTKNGKGKAKATEKVTAQPKGKTKAVEVLDDGSGDEAPAPKSPRKRKAPAEDSDAEPETSSKKRTKAATKKGNPRVGTGDSLPKQPPSGPTRDTSHGSNDRASMDADPIQKKKRKINIFAGAGSQSQPGGFDFGLGGVRFPFFFPFRYHMPRTHRSI